ncbi:MULTISPECIES: hypothetical protein [Paenibacillus]|uniref:hypothetical protein n=1 Tax=Paenibacillus TaxID=44249 RepID=UPI0022B8E605|nr:hypothetical protein [Paenibacillus caseinilyticus]MCZ8522050.1 hypothetical protein [Paenibacillus caseinilyticus]
MNDTYRRTLWGVAYGLVASVIFSLFIAVLANGLAGGGGAEGWFWFFGGLSIPLCITLGIAGYFHAFQALSRSKFWFLCAFIGFINVLYMGTAGAIMGSSLAFGGLRQVNVSGYWVWGPVYAICCLPLSTAAAAFLLSAFRNFLKIRGLLQE